MGRTAIIGFGCAGYHAAELLREKQPQGIIDIYSDTAEAPCNPMLTTYYVSDKIQAPTLFPFGGLAEIRRRLGVNVFAEKKVTRLHAKARVVETADGRSAPYDDIVICTGAYPVVPPFARGLKENSFTMRTAGDARALKAALDGSAVKSALVVGGQMVGIKVVELLHARGVKTTLVDMAEHLFPVSACKDIAEAIQRRLTEKGIEQRYSCALSAVENTPGGVRAVLADGSVLETDIIVFCSGIRANVPFVDPSELDMGRCITVNLRMQTSLPHVYACGDCCEVRDIQTGQVSNIGLWANSGVQGKIAARNICGDAVEYQGNLIHNITHFMDMDFISMGNCSAPGAHMHWQDRDGKWEIEAIMGGSGRPECINILDNEKVAGPLKALLIKRFKSPSARWSTAVALRLVNSGMPPAIIEALCEKTADGARESEVTL